MLAATKVKMSGKEKIVNKNTYDISSIKRVTRSRVVVVQKTAKKLNVQKSELHVRSCFFAN